MKIKVSGLSNGTYNYDFNFGIKNLELEEPFFGDYYTNVVLNKFDDQIIIESSTSVDASFICDRCSKEFVRTVESKYKMVYLLRDISSKSEEVDVTYLPHDADKIDISQDVRDYLILSIPMKKLCKEDCKGLCYKCGKDLNEGKCDCPEQEIDERWKPLLELKNKINKN
ncbi:MAG: DUF177 domain-containing protein [Ignavibacteriaceae bacterium]